MTRTLIFLALAFVVAGWVPQADAIGRGGGRGFRGGMPAGRPNINMPATRPNVSMPHVSVPQFGARPGGGMPNVNLPATRPQLPAGRLPNVPNLPSGGMKPTTRPSFPTQLPSTRPGTLPGNISRPTQPTMPPNVSIPNFGGTRPTTRPDFPRPGQPGIATRPSLPSPGTRPSPGDLGDFLGIQRPVERPSTLPGALPGTRPVPTPLPGIADRPGAGSRPDWLTRPAPGGIGRPGQVGDRWQNNIIHNRPTWANISPVTINQINNTWQTAITRPGFAGQNWLAQNPARFRYWNGWGNGIRTRWPYFRGDHVWFNGSWWRDHPHAIGGWHYWWHFNRYGYAYWWRRPAWGALATWFVWAPPPAVWSQPVFYDYGTGGNVVFQDNMVYVNAEPVATTADFAASAAELATVAPPADDAQAEAAEWMPLGTFAVSTNQKDVDPNQVVQLAVDRQGVVAGSWYNTQTGQASAVQGQVDKQTQRVAIRVGTNEEFVAETGLYNLTQEEVPLLVHFGTDHTETWLLVRLEQPDESAQPAQQ